MAGFIAYNIKVAVCLAVFYLFYKLFLSRDTFHRVNRVVLLAAMALSFVLPLCVITVYRQAEPAAEPVSAAGTGIELPEELLGMWLAASGGAAETAASGGDTSWPGWGGAVSLLFVIGAVGAFAWVLLSVLRVMGIIRSGEKEPMGRKVVLVKKNEDLIPFSWIRYIVVSKRDLAGSGEHIIRHEKAHIELRHSYDLMLADLACCMQWFNPAMWLLRRELTAIHEYEADRAVLASGADPREYQMLLIKKAVGTGRYSIANSLNHSKLKNRITMMLKQKSNPGAKAKILLLLPLVCFGLTAFARTEYVPAEDKVNEKNSTSLHSAVEDVRLHINAVSEPDMRTVDSGTVEDPIVNMAVSANGGELPAGVYAENAGNSPEASAQEPVKLKQVEKAELKPDGVQIFTRREKSGDDDDEPFTGRREMYTVTADGDTVLLYRIMRPAGMKNDKDLVAFYKELEENPEMKERYGKVIEEWKADAEKYSDITYTSSIGPEEYRRIIEEQKADAEKYRKMMAEEWKADAEKYNEMLEEQRRANAEKYRKMIAEARKADNEKYRSMLAEEQKADAEKYRGIKAEARKANAEKYRVSAGENRVYMEKSDMDADSMKKEPDNHVAGNRVYVVDAGGKPQNYTSAKRSQAGYTGPAQHAVKEIRIDIDKKGRISMDGRRVTVDELGDAVADAGKNNVNRRVVIVIDKESKAGVMEDVVAVLRKNGVTNIVFTTNPAGSDAGVAPWTYAASSPDITIMINRKGEIRVGNSILRGANLESALREELKSVKKSPVVAVFNVVTDRDTDAKYLDEVKDILKKMGARRVSYTTNSKR